MTAHEILEQISNEGSIYSKYSITHKYFFSIKDTRNSLFLVEHLWLKTDIIKHY